MYLSSLNHILVGHYEGSGMQDGKVPDIDNWLKETEIDDRRLYNFVKEKIANKNGLDFGCSVGGFLGMAKEVSNTAKGAELKRIR